MNSWRAAAAAALIVVALASCRVPSAPGTAGLFVLNLTDGLPLPAVLDTANGGWGASEVQLLAAELELRANGELRWTRSVRMRQLEPVPEAAWDDIRRLAGWYAVDGDRIEIELLTGAIDDGSTMRISGTFVPGRVGLFVPRSQRALPRLESYVLVR